MPFRFRLHVLAAAGLLALSGCLDPSSHDLLDGDETERGQAETPASPTEPRSRPRPGLRLPSALQSYGL